MDSDRRFIAIDQGNTMLKLTLFSGKNVVDTCRFPTGAVEDVFSVLERWRADSGAFCSVGRMDSRMVESLRLALEGRLLILSRSTRLPIGIDYRTPSTLGLDRIALAAGAAHLYGGECVMVVDAGTAVTLDLIDATPAFRGGRITAGMRLRFKALHANTSALPEVDASGSLSMIGDSTETSIRSGVVLGLSDEIVETYRQYKENYGCARAVLTGGNSELLSECIKTRIPADHVPDLMARGLLYIYEYNEI